MTDSSGPQPFQLSRPAEVAAGKERGWFCTRVHTVFINAALCVHARMLVHHFHRPGSQ